MACKRHLRAFTPGDRFLLSRWLGEAEVVSWFGSRAVADAECALAQSSASALVRIIMLDVRPIGYVQAYDSAMISGGRPSALRDGVYLATVLIGPADAHGHGHGAAAVGLLRDEIFASTFASAVAMLVPLKNEPAVRAMEREGFKWSEIWRDASIGPCWVMVATRPPS